MLSAQPRKSKCLRVSVRIQSSVRARTLCNVALLIRKKCWVMIYFYQTLSRCCFLREIVLREHLPFLFSNFPSLQAKLVLPYRQEHSAAYFTQLQGPQLHCPFILVQLNAFPSAVLYRRLVDLSFCKRISLCSGRKLESMAHSLLQSEFYAQIWNVLISPNLHKRCSLPEVRVFSLLI